MKKLLTLFLILFTLTASAQDRSRNVNQKCVTTVVEHLEKVKTIRTYLKKEWDKLVAQRKERGKKRRGGN
jgi:hypothetical protein